MNKHLSLKRLEHLKKLWKTPQTIKQIEHARKMGLARKDKKLSEEHKRKIGLKSKGNKYALGNHSLSPKRIKALKELWKAPRTPKQMENAREMGFSSKGEKNWSWRGGISFEPYPLNWNKTFKEQIRYKDKYTCQLCGVPEIECSRKLDVHHIDYDKQNLDLNNLLSLCKSCHSKTNGNRDYWKEYFRKEILVS